MMVAAVTAGLREIEDEELDSEFDETEFERSIFLKTI